MSQVCDYTKPFVKGDWNISEPIESTNPSYTSICLYIKYKGQREFIIKLPKVFAYGFQKEEGSIRDYAFTYLLDEVVDPEKKVPLDTFFNSLDAYASEKIVEYATKAIKQYENKEKNITLSLSLAKDLLDPTKRKPIFTYSTEKEPGASSKRHYIKYDPQNIKKNRTKVQFRDNFGKTITFEDVSCITSNVGSNGPKKGWYELNVTLPFIFLGNRPKEDYKSGFNVSLVHLKFEMKPEDSADDHFKYDKPVSQKEDHPAETAETAETAEPAEPAEFIDEIIE
uniref:Uncharacterized protein n=1 Tax=viral metagenome TaxID=1070528 RepID=A0A6C0JS53_9ZZZZ